MNITLKISVCHKEEEFLDLLRCPPTIGCDARMDNTLTANVSKYVVVILNVQIINDKQVSTRTQVKEVLALGLSYTLF